MGPQPSDGLRPPTWWAFLVLNALVVPFCFLGLSEEDTDAFYRLASGRWMHEHGRVLDHEAFSFTVPGRPWTNYSWAFEWSLYAAYRWAGFAGVFALRSLFVLVTVNLFLLLVHRRTQGARLETIAFGLLLLPIYIIRSANARPNVASYLFLVAALLLADAFDRGRRAAGIGLVALCVVWANVHGVEYPVVLAVLAVYLLDAVRPHLRERLAAMAHDTRVRRWAALLAACSLAFVVNPFGWRLLLPALMVREAEVMAQIAEMQPLTAASFGQLWPVLHLNSWVPLRLVALAGLALLPLLLRAGQFRSAALFALGLALVHDKGRFSVEFLILALPAVAAAAAIAGRRRPARAWPRYLMAAAAVHVAVSAAVTLADKVRSGGFEAVSSAVHPIGAVRFIEQAGLSGNLGGDPTWAGYVSWRLYPRVRVAMDMRTPEPFHAHELWLSLAVGDRIPAQRFEERWPIDLLLLLRTHRRAALLRADPGFAPVYADSRFVVFARVRQGTPGQPPPLTTLQFLEALEAGRELPPPPSPAVLRAEAERLAAASEANDLAQGGLLWLLLQEGRAQDARLRARSLAARFPYRAPFHHYEGVALQQLGRQSDAERALRRATALAPGFLPSHVALAQTLLALGRAEDALDVMEQAAWKRWHLLSGREYALLGSLRRQAGRWEPARDAFERASWLTGPEDPIRPDVLNDLAVASLARGDAVRALAALDEAVARRPTFPLARLNRARTLRRLGREAEGRAVLDALAAEPDLPPPLRAAVQAERAR